VSQNNPVIDYDDEQRHHILLADDSIVIQKMVKRILQEHNYKLTITSDGSEAITVLQKEKVDFVITDINMPQVGGFDLVKKLKEFNLDIPYTMITDANIDQYLELAIKHDVGNILSKPIEKTELLNTVYKLLNPETLFGLKNYLATDESQLNTIDVTTSQQCQESVLQLVKEAENSGLEADFIPSLRLILSEMAINALYHSHGFTDKKESGEAVQLEDGDKIQLQYGYDDLKFGVSITDFEGKLTKLTILSTFKQFIEDSVNMTKAIEKGEDPTQYIKDKGRGLQLAREMANEYYFNIEPNKKTEIVILCWLKKKEITHANHSIKINELT